MKNVYLVRAAKLCLLTVVLAFTGTFANAQLSGTYTISPTYPTIASFVADLNVQGVGTGGVNFNVPSGYAETAPAGGYAITATGTVTNPIVIAGTGLPKPIITASASLTVGALNDAIFKIIGGDYITLSNLDLRENAGNTITAAATNNMTEWGIALLYATTSDGAQNCSIVGNTITLNRTYQNTFGIYVNATHTDSAPTTTATAIAGGGNTGLKVYGNAVSNVNIGILVVGPTAAADQNDGIDIGGGSLTTGNILTNYGTTGTFSSYANVSGTVNGILVRNSKNVNISYNSVASSVGGTTVGTLRGIWIQAATNAPTGTFTNTISNNTVSLRAATATGAMYSVNVDATTTTATSTLNITNNDFNTTTHTVASSGTIGLIYNSATLGTMTITANTFSNIASNTTGTFYFIYNNTSLPTFTISNNSVVGNFSKTGAGGTVYGYYNFGSPTSGTATLIGNNFSNITITGATTFYGIRQYTSTTQIEILQNNTVSNITGGTSAIYGVSHGYGAAGSIVSGNTVFSMSSGAAVYGVQIGDGSGGTVDCYNNTVYGLSSTGASTVYGVNVNGALNAKVYGNKVYGLQANNAAGIVFGINVANATSVSLYNNVVSGLTAPITSSANGIVGINVAGGTTVTAYYNSVYLSGTSSGLNFGSSAISVSTTPNVTLTNNIFINECAAVGTGFAVASRRNSTTLASYNAASNRNLFYAGVPSASRLIMYDGTNSYQTLATYQAAVSTRDANSITGEAFTYGTPGSYFISLTGSSVDFLRPVTGLVTQTESGAVNISSPLITTDYASVTRAGNAGYTGTGSAPDMGAYEFEGVTPTPTIVFNSASPATTPQCVATARTISADFTTSSGTIVSGSIVYAFNGTPQGSVSMTNTGGNTWSGVIPAATPLNATVTWVVVATNSLGLNGSYTGTSYSDEPLTGVTASVSATSTTLCAGSPTQLSAQLAKSVTVPSGTGTGTSSSMGISPFYHGYGAAKTQYIFRASELSAMGLAAGNITSFSLNITTLGTPTLNAFSINMGHTAQNAAVANTAIIAGLTSVYTNAAQPLVLGVNNFAITPFNWDGTSNVVISFVYSNNNTGGSSSTVTTDPALSFTSSLAIVADNAVESCIFPAVSSGQACMGTNTNTTSSTRPRIIFSGNAAPAISSVTWMDGVTTVGTGNPLTVNPTVTTTYTANITSAGCVFAPAPTVAVTVNALLPAPTALNSAQCGTQIPTASVTSTSGQSTPTFIWYDLPTGGTVQQSNVSTTYLSNVATTTTFYVSELDGVTGCESPRTAVTVTVASADGILASTSSATICIGGSVTLTASNTNPSPNQSYTYAWDGTAGSGVGTAVPGASISATPTAPATYVYSLTGVDGGCSAVSTVSVTVNPFTAAVTAIDITCNGYNNGSFALGATTCGTAPYDYSVDNGLYGGIPTNLTPGAHTVVVRDANFYESAVLNITIAEPSTVINAPTTVDALVCVGEPVANVSATVVTNVPTPLTITLPLAISVQPIEVNAAPGNIVTSVTVPVLPAGAVVTGVTINLNGLITNGGEWQSDVRLGLSGIFTNAAAQGTGTINAGGNFNYTRAIPGAGFPLTGGTLNLLYWDNFNDVSGGDDCTFPLGSNVGSIVINYTIPTEGTISWWSASTAGTMEGAGSPFNAVGTTVLPNTSTPGVYTLYAQGEYAGCSGLTRTPVTVVVNSPSTSSTTISNCTNYTWTNGTTYNVSGTYTQTLTNAVGCDSIATLNLTIIPPTSSTTTISNCVDYTWTNGTTYTASGSYTQTLVNAAGCDSIATLDLTIIAPTASTTTISNCVDYTWTNGTTYTASGSYTQTLVNAAGCDSIATLDLTILTPTASTTTISNCVNYTWTNGTTYTTSGIYTQTLTNAEGCDSLATLDLTINVPTSSTETVSACGSYTWSATGATYTTSGTLTATLVNAAGCDSIATLILTINTFPTATAVDNGDATISSGATTGNQWINCATGAPIAGATSQTFAPTANGSYAVIVTGAGGCADTSACVTINNVNVKEIAADNVSVFPNPTTNNVTITFTSPEANTELVDANGRVVRVAQITSGGTVDLSDCENGIYYIRLTTDNGTSVHKVIKQ